MHVWPFCFLHMFVEFLDKFPSEPPAFTQMRGGGGEGNFTIPLGEPVYELFNSYWCLGD